MIPDINLLPKKERKAAGGKWLPVVFIILVFLAAMAMVFQSAFLSKNIRQLEVTEREFIVGKEALEVELSTLESPKALDLEATVQWIEQISYPVSPLLIEFKKYLGAHAYLRDFTFGEETVSFSVDFETISDVAMYVEDLLGSPFVKDVLVQEMTSFDVTDDKEKQNFNVIDRYANKFEVSIDVNYLHEVGGE